LNIQTSDTNKLIKVYYKEAVGAFVVFDVTRLTTLEAAAKWKNDLDSKVTVGVEELPIPVVLLANKVIFVQFKIRS
jgi:signal recognition particle receptor subunit beta